VLAGIEGSGRIKGRETASKAVGSQIHERVVRRNTYENITKEQETLCAGLKTLPSSHEDRGPSSSNFRSSLRAIPHPTRIPTSQLNPQDGLLRVLLHRRRAAARTNKIPLASRTAKFLALHNDRWSSDDLRNKCVFLECATAARLGNTMVRLQFSFTSQ